MGDKSVTNESIRKSAKVAQASNNPEPKTLTTNDKSPKKKSSKKKPDDVLVTIDLTDPQDLMKKLEMIDFTEEETEELIQQAYEVNKLLKKKLQKQEFETLRQSFGRSVTISSSGRKTSGIMNSNLPPMTMGSNLPPMSMTFGEKGSPCGKTKMASLAFSKQGAQSVPSSASSKQSEKLSGKSRTGTPKSTKKAKPDWNERWNAE